MLREGLEASGRIRGGGIDLSHPKGQWAAERYSGNCQFMGLMPRLSEALMVNDLVWKKRLPRQHWRSQRVIVNSNVLGMRKVAMKD